MADKMTEVTLKEHIETQIKWLDRHFETQIKAIDESTRKAAEQIDERLKGMNEFRAENRDQAARCPTRIEVDTHFDSIETRIKSMELSRAQGEGRSLMISGFVAFVASIFVSIIVHWAVK